MPSCTDRRRRSRLFSPPSTRVPRRGADLRGAATAEQLNRKLLAFFHGRLIQGIDAIEQAGVNRDALVEIDQLTDDMLVERGQAQGHVGVAGLRDDLARGLEFSFEDLTHLFSRQVRKIFPVFFRYRNGKILIPGIERQEGEYRSEEHTSELQSH